MTPAERKNTAKDLRKWARQLEEKDPAVFAENIARLRRQADRLDPQP
jgi:hypothetical protein